MEKHLKDIAGAALSVLLFGAAALLQGCGTGPVTTLETSWASPQLPKEPFKKLLIISMSHEDFVQVAFQDQMAAALKARGMNAVASKGYFTPYTTDAAASKARFKQIIDASGADFVLFARVTGTDSKSRDDRFMTFGDATGIYTAYDRYVSVGRSQGDFKEKTITSEVSIFNMEGEKLIWSARIRTVNPAAVTGAQYAPEYVETILDAMERDRLL
jgi:hypothetical protein